MNMKQSIHLRFAALSIIGLAGMSLATARALQDSPPPVQEVWATTSWSMNTPATYTDEELTEAETAYLNGDPLPAGFSLVEDLGASTGVLTGTSLLSGETKLVISCVDQTADLG